MTLSYLPTPGDATSPASCRETAAFSSGKRGIRRRHILIATETPDHFGALVSILVPEGVAISFCLPECIAVIRQRGNDPSLIVIDQPDPDIILTSDALTRACGDIPVLLLTADHIPSYPGLVQAKMPDSMSDLADEVRMIIGLPQPGESFIAALKRVFHA